MKTSVSFFLIILLSFWLIGCDEDNSKACNVIQCDGSQGSPSSPNMDTPAGVGKVYSTTHGSYTFESISTGKIDDDYGVIYGVRAWGGDIYLYVREKISNYIYHIVIYKITEKGTKQTELCRWIDDGNFKKGLWVDEDRFYLSKTYSRGTFREFSKVDCSEQVELDFGLNRTGLYYSMSNELVFEGGRYLWMRGYNLVELSVGGVLLREFQPQKIGTQSLDWRSIDAIDAESGTIWAADGWRLWQLDGDGRAKAWGNFPREDYKQIQSIHAVTLLEEGRLLIVSSDYGGEYGFFVMNISQFKTW